MKLSEQKHYYDEEDGCMVIGGIQYDALVLFDEVIKLEAYVDKLANGLPLLPKDIEILQKANADLAETNTQLETERNRLYGIGQELNARVRVLEAHVPESVLRRLDAQIK